MSDDLGNLHASGRPSTSFWRDAAIAVALLSAATLINIALSHHTTSLSGAMVYVLAVVLASYLLSRTAAVMTAAVSVLCLNYLFIEPRYSLHVDAQENAAALLAMLCVALVISHLAAVSMRETESARQNERRAKQLQELATDLGGSSTPSEVRALAQDYLSREFHGPCLVALLSADGGLEGFTCKSEVRDGLLACTREATALGPGTARWPALHAWYLPLKSESHVGGAACIQDVRASDTDGLEQAQALCALVGQALWRMRLATAVLEAEKRSQWQRAQNTFLAAISHDFRTPLASITAAASSLEVQRGRLGPEEQAQLLQTISTEVNHLISLTENTLQLVRLENAGDLALDWQSIEEIVGAVLRRIRTRHPGGRVRAHVPDQLALVKGDPVLLAQLLENLLENALKFSADLVEVIVSSAGNHITLAVQDRGVGIAVGEESAIFEPFRRSDQSGKRGTGLGLALCRSIARAHNGQLTAVRREGGGTSFVLRLPLDQAQPVPAPA